MEEEKTKEVSNALVTGQNNLKKIKRREEEKEKIQEEINYFWEKLKTLKKLEIDYSPIIRIINILKNSARLEIVE
jgi:uncharacterized protein (UPF0335 family)